MEVYFENHRSWDLVSGEKEEPKRKPGTPVIVNKEFEYGGFWWICPRIYLCREGIVMHLCRRYEASAFKEFYDKWADRIDALSHEEQEQIAKENPMNFLCSLRLDLDGNKPESSGWSGMGWQPYFPEQNSPRSEEYLDEYGLSREFGWYIYRAKYEYPKDVYVDFLKETEDTGAALERLTLRIAAEQEQIYFAEKITTRVDCEPFNVELKHPLTGDTHQFFVGACSAENFDNMPQQLTQDMIIPDKNCVLVYAVSPELSAEEVFCVQDQAPSDTPISRSKGKGHNAASSIAIIGSADGPTSVFLAGKIGGKSAILEKAKAANAGKEVHWKTVCSSLTFEPVKEVTWKCSIHVAPFAPMEIPLFTKQ